jgi:hypothetical protein
MARVSLEFRTESFLSAEFAYRPLHFIRLIVGVEFVLPDGTLTVSQPAILDTGAPWCVLPRYVWRPLDMEIHTAETRFGGLNKRKLCQIPAAAATVRGRLVDTAGQATRIYAFPAYLAKSDRVPLIVGLADLVERFGVYFNHRTGEAWIEEP